MEDPTVTVRVELAVPPVVSGRMLGLKDVAIPLVGGETVAVKATVPEKPKLLTPTLADAPAEPHTGAEICTAVIVKLGVTMTVTEMA